MGTPKRRILTETFRYVEDAGKYCAINCALVSVNTGMYAREDSYVKLEALNKAEDEIARLKKEVKRLKSETPIQRPTKRIDGYLV